MGLFNHLFGSEKDIAEELVLDDNKRIALWNEHLSNHLSRKELSKNFNYKTVEIALQDFEATDKVLRQIEALISLELVNIANEDKTDEEILADLERLKSISEVKELADIVRSVKQKQSALLNLFQEIFNVLKAELHLIRLIRKNPKNVRDLLLRLFELIFFHETTLYKVFREQDFFKENIHIHAKIIRIARAIMLEEKIEEEMETDEEILVGEILKQMALDESESIYRRLGEEIYVELAEMAGASMPRGGDISIAKTHFKDLIKKLDSIFNKIKVKKVVIAGDLKHEFGSIGMEKIMGSDKKMYKIAKKIAKELGLKYDDTEIRAIILAFRKAYSLGYFDELEPESYT